nr:hypothetical protein [Rhodopirellula sp. SM50]
MFKPLKIPQGAQMLRKFTTAAFACALTVSMIGCEKPADTTDTSAEEAVEVVVEETEEAAVETEEAAEAAEESVEESVEEAAEAVEEEAAAE